MEFLLMNISLFNIKPPEKKKWKALKKRFVRHGNSDEERHVRELVTSGDIEFILNFIRHKKIESSTYREWMMMHNIDGCIADGKEEGALIVQRENVAGNGNIKGREEEKKKLFTWRCIICIQIGVINVICCSWRIITSEWWHGDHVITIIDTFTII